MTYNFLLYTAGCFGPKKQYGVKYFLFYLYVKEGGTIHETHVTAPPPVRVPLWLQSQSLSNTCTVCKSWYVEKMLIMNGCYLKNIGI